MGYIDYPDIKPPTKIKQNTKTNIKAVHRGHWISFRTTAKPIQADKYKACAQKQ